jgi:hypothetical protein
MRKPLVLIVALFTSALASTPLTAAAPKFSFSSPEAITLPEGYGGVIAIGDVNGDGKTDLLTDGGLLWGNGKGGFTPSGIDESALLHPNTTNPVSFPFPMVDLDGDGHLDFVQLVHGLFDPDHCDDTGDSLNIFLGDGKGHFTFKASYSLNKSDIDTAVVGDFTKDGKPDLALIGLSTDPCAYPGDAHQFAIVTVLKNLGGGNFSPSFFNEDTLQATGSAVGWNAGATTLQIGDFNGDGKLDLAFTGYKQQDTGTILENDVQVLYGNGDGTLREGTFYLLDSAPSALFAAELNGDKRTDLVVSLAARHAAGAEPRVATLLAKDTGNFSWQSAVSHKDTWSEVDTSAVGGSLVDLNGDGKLDAPFWDNRGSSSTSELEILGGEGAGTFAPPAAFSVGKSPTSIRAIQLVKGGAIDMLVETAGSTSTTESLLINKE